MPEDDLKLTADELAAAQRVGTDPGRYAALKGVRSIDDFERLQAGSSEVEREADRS